MKEKPDNQNIGNAGEYFIASVLSSYGFTVTITLGRSEIYDLLCVKGNGSAIKIQVKTAWYKTNAWRLSDKNENYYAEDFFYAFVSLNENKKSPDFWIVPSKLVVECIKEGHEIWLKIPGIRGQAHNDNRGRQFHIKPCNYTPERCKSEIENLKTNDIEPILEYTGIIKKNE